MGNQIVIYYGSFMRLYGKAAGQTFERELRAVLRHEFRHHMENRAGERGLEIEDERQLREYLDIEIAALRMRILLAARRNNDAAMQDVYKRQPLRH